MYVLGLYIEGSILKTALLRREEKKHIHVDFVRSFDLQETKDIQAVLQNLLKNKKFILSTGLDAWEILLRGIQLQLKRKRELLSVLPFQSESLIPYPLEEAILIPFSSPVDQEGTEVTLFATKKEYVSSHIEKMQTLKFDPDHISAIPVALWRYARAYQTEESATIFYLGLEKSCCLCFYKEKILFSQTLQIGLNELHAALAEDNPSLALEHVDCITLDPEEFPCLNESLGKLRCEWERLRSLLEKRNYPLSFSFVGNIPRSLLLFLEQTISTPTRLEKTDLSLHAIPIGLALDALHQDEHSIQLRQNIFAPKGLFKKRIKKLGLCLLSIATLTAATWGSSHLFLVKKEKALSKKLELLRKKQIESKKQALIQEVRQWSKSLSGKKIPFPYQLTTPTVSEFLAWISSHSQLSQEGIDIKRLRYVLVKYPTLNKTQLPYQAKVELDFTASSPTLARSFHEALLRGEGLVNPNHEISWDVHDNHYQTSFILREHCQ